MTTRIGTVKPRMPIRRRSPSGAISPPKTPPPTDPISPRPSAIWGTSIDDTHRFGDAENAYKEALAVLRDLAAQNPAAYRPDLANTLSNLGNYVNAETHRFGDAENAYKEALAILRDLAAQNPAAYRPDLAKTSAIWGTSMSKRIGSVTPRMPIRRRSPSCAISPPRTPPPTGPISPEPSTIWGSSMTNKHRFGDAESAYKEALAI